MSMASLRATKLDSIFQIMASEDVGKKSLCADPDAEDIVSEPQKTIDNIDDDIFTMEEFWRQPKEGNQRANTTAMDFARDPSVQPPVKALVESVSIIQCSEVDTIQRFSNGNDSAVINGTVEQNKQAGIHEGVKRSHEECGNSMETSVRVVYTSLPSRSKRKLEELLGQWSDWHAKHCASSEDPADSIESGEESYFPALHIGSDTPSTVSFSMDVHVSKRQRTESGSLNHESSSVYDRGFAVGLASDTGASEERDVDLREAPRCFNCGSFNHPLSGCTKPFNKAAVTSARKEFQSKKNPSGSPRVLTRYYQDSPGGKFDGLKPGTLSSDTRKLLGLGELDPPPWLNRMRELGYPLGYLDPQEEEEQPSGIAIFGDDETQNGDPKNDPALGVLNSQKKVIVEFPGINAPIPENADQTRWATLRSPIIPDFSLNWADNRWNFTPNSIGNGNFHGAYGPRSQIDGPSSPLGFGVPRPHNHYPSEPFNQMGLPIRGRPHYGTPFMHHKYGSF